MTGEARTRHSPSNLNREPISFQSPTCSRNATKASGFTWCYWCDPTVPEDTKAAARQLGGRRGLIPCLMFYVLGWAIGWVRRGFAGGASSQ